MARNKRGGGRPDGAEPADRSGKTRAGKPVKAVKAVKAVKPVKAERVDRPGKPGKPRSEPAPAPNIRVQLPYFAARIVVFVVALIVLLLATNLVAVWAVLFALVFAGVTTYPLVRMQKAAAARAASPPSP